MQLSIIPFVLLTVASAAVAAPIESRALPTPISTDTAKEYLSQCTYFVIFVRHPSSEAAIVISTTMIGEYVILVAHSCEAQSFIAVIFGSVIRLSTHHLSLTTSITDVESKCIATMNLSLADMFVPELFLRQFALVTVYQSALNAFRLS